MQKFQPQFQSSNSKKKSLRPNNTGLKPRLVRKISAKERAEEEHYAKLLEECEWLKKVDNMDGKIESSDSSKKTKEGYFAAKSKREEEEFYAQKLIEFEEMTAYVKSSEKKYTPIVSESRNLRSCMKTSTSKKPTPISKLNSPKRNPHKRTSRALFSKMCSASPPKCSGKRLRFNVDEKENLSDDCNLLVMDDDVFNDSSAEFEKLESICSRKKSGTSSPMSPMVELGKKLADATLTMGQLDIFADVQKFIDKKYQETQEKVEAILKEDKDAITEFIKLKTREAENLLQENSLLTYKNTNQKKAKSNNLLVSALTKNLTGKQITMPDTPSTHKKMTEAIKIYSSIRENLDSPRLTKKSLTTPSSSKHSKQNLSIRVQKQCLALVE